MQNSKLQRGKIRKNDPEKIKKCKNQVFHIIPKNFHDPWLGTDTPGYGEAVFAGQDLQKQAGKPNLKKNLAVHQILARF